MKVYGVIALLLGVCILTGPGCRTAGRRSAEADQKKAPEYVYNRFNIHVVESPDRGGVINRASYANWVAPIDKHWIVPANTKLKVIYRRRGIFPGYKFTIADTGRELYYEFNSRNTGMNPSEYLRLITAPNPTSHAGLTELDKQGIKEGKALVGMTKMGVRIALGHPANHRTPSLQANTWTYWRDRYRTMLVTFGEDGKVTAIK